MMGGYINLVTNQPISFKAKTEQTLAKFGMKYDQILFSNATSIKEAVQTDKNERFKAIEKGIFPSKFSKQKILAWLGDNAQDIPNLKQKEIFEKPADNIYKAFGQKYFILPNPIYGSWLSLKVDNCS